jgi:hypothetical protein
MKVIASLVCLASLFGMSAFAMAQSSAAAPKTDLERGDVTFRRLATLDVSLKILPVAFTKEQINALLPVLERCRNKEKQIRELDAKEFIKIEEKVENALKGAIEQSRYPTNEFKEEIAKLTNAIAVRRQLATNEMVDTIYEAMKKSLNTGQIKAISNLIDPKYGNGTENPSKMTEEERIRFYIRGIMMDATTYELLRKMVQFTK